MPDIFIDAEPGNPICDFCSAQNPRWEFQIEAGHEIGEDHVMGRELHSMDRDGLWGACDVCKEFIVNRQNAALAERSMNHFFKLYGIANTEANRNLAIGRVRQAHNFFFSRWDGTDPKGLDN